MTIFSLSNNNPTNFDDFPGEIKLKILSLSYFADIFSFMRVSQDYKQTGRVAFITRAQFLGYQKGSQDQNYEDASNYIKHFFVRFTHEKTSCLFVSKYRSREKAISNEESFLNINFQDPKMQLSLLNSLEKNSWRRENILYKMLMVKPTKNICFEPGKEHVSYFCKKFFNYDIPSEVYDYFPFIFKTQKVYRKFSLLGLVASLIGNNLFLFKTIFKNNNLPMNIYEELGTFPQTQFYQKVIDVDGNTLVHLAASLGRKSISEFMFSFRTGSSAIQCLKMKNRHGETPLDLALSQGHKVLSTYLQQQEPSLQPNTMALLKFVRKTKNFNLEDNHRTFFLNYISEENQKKYAVEIAQTFILIRKYIGDSEVSIPNSPLREICLKEAVKQNNFRFVDLWMDEESVNYKDENGKTLLEIAFEIKSFRMAAKLMLAGHQVKDIQTILTVLEDLKSNRQRLSFLRSVVRSGIDISDLVFTASNRCHSYIKNTKKVYQRLKSNKFSKLVIELNKKNPAIIDVLIAGAANKDPNVQKFLKINDFDDQIKITLLEPLFYDMYDTATKLSKINLRFKEFILRSIPTYHPGFANGKMTLLTIAASIGCQELVTHLLNKGWNIDQPNNALIAFHSAVRGNDLLKKKKPHDFTRPIVDLLLDENFRANFKNS